jgi:hypothetical protein
MKKIQLFRYFFVLLFLTNSFNSFSQSCPGISVSYTILESRCAATGSIEITATGGSGIYNYKVVGPINTPYSSTNIISGLPAGNYQVIIKDVNNNCTRNPDWVTVPGTYDDPRFQLQVADVTCTNGADGMITVSNLEYGRAPFTYTIIAPSASGVGTVNTTGVFNGLASGSYLIQLKDSCGGIQTRLAKVKNYTWVFQTGTVTKFTCDSAAAFIALKDMNENLNTSGLGFSNFSYGVSRTPGDTLWFNTNNFKFFLGKRRSVLLLAKDNCGNIKSMVWNTPTRPAVAAAVTISNFTCVDFRARITGQANLTNPQYCIYNSLNVLVSCNNSGQFNNLPFGSYCIRVLDVCYDTTIVRCFTQNKPVPSIANTVTISNGNCAAFTASITGQTNFTGANYCLYDNFNNLITCNTNGVFNNLNPGSYCINVVLTNGAGSCYDTTIRRCFTVNRMIPSVAAAVTLSSYGCTTFSARITGQTNLTNPQYYLYSGTTLLRQNTTGIFNAIPYGAYCIDIENGCGDTIIRRCFTGSPVPVNINANMFFSCLIGHTRLEALFTTGIAPYRIEVYNHLNILVRSVSSASTTIKIDSLPSLPAGSSYRIVGYDACNRFEQEIKAAQPSTLIKTVNIKANCPGGMQPNGSSDIRVNVSSNLGTVIPKITLKNGVSVNLPASYTLGTQHDFFDLDPATYVVTYQITSCVSTNDTVVVAPYSYPSLGNSNAYQCDNSSFSVGAAVTGGLSPYQYEIIGSAPMLPNIVAAPQTNPVFNINTGATYSLVRLRTVDGCGNATLNDVSVLPLANISVTANSTCYYNNVVLSIDTIATATYTWYKRVGVNDSMLLGSALAYDIPQLLPPDTGRYICKVSVNNGCLVRLSNFTLTPTCGFALLPDEKLILSGKIKNGLAELEWLMKNEADVKEYAIERNEKQGGEYTTIGKVAAGKGTAGVASYGFTDSDPREGVNYYRIKAIAHSGKIVVSNIINLKKGFSAAITVFPNPVVDKLNINFGSSGTHSHQIMLLDMNGRTVFEKMILNSRVQDYVYRRQQTMEAGTYILKIVNLNNQEISNLRIVFK